MHGASPTPTRRQAGDVGNSKTARPSGPWGVGGRGGGGGGGESQEEAGSSKDMTNSGRNVLIG